MCRTTTIIDEITFSFLCEYQLRIIYVLGKWVLVLVGLLPPMDPFLDQNFTRTGEITMEWAKLPPHQQNHLFVHTIL
jgi:hypothetical protein